jgi:hypothetical protein
MTAGAKMSKRLFDRTADHFSIIAFGASAVVKILDAYKGSSILLLAIGHK